jgi:hypothetical protein
MIAAQPGGCNAAVDYTTRGLAMPEDDGNGHPGKGKSANSRHCGSTVDWTRGVGLTVLGDGDLIADMGPRNEALP